MSTAKRALLEELEKFGSADEDVGAWEDSEDRRPVVASGEAVSILEDQVEQYRAAGWTVERFSGHHGIAGYWLATKEFE